MKTVLGILFIVHGLIVAGQSSGSFGSTIPNEIPNPAFVSWWPLNMGRSWLFSMLGLDKTPIVYRIGGLLWLIGGIILVAAGLGILGFIIPTEWWRGLAIAGAAMSLFMLIVYLHPAMIIGTVSSLAVLIALLWAHWPPVSLIR